LHITVFLVLLVHIPSIHIKNTTHKQTYITPWCIGPYVCCNAWFSLVDSVKFKDAGWLHSPFRLVRADKLYNGTRCLAN